MSAYPVQNLLFALAGGTYQSLFQGFFGCRSVRKELVPAKRHFYNVNPVKRAQDSREITALQVILVGFAVNAQMVFTGLIIAVKGAQMLPEA